VIIDFSKRNSQIINEFQEDGLVLVPQLVLERDVRRLSREVEDVINGIYSTGLAPDKVKWKPGDKEDVVRSVCNAWKSSTVIKSFITMNSAIPSIAKQLMGWKSVKLNQDSILVVPPGSKGVTFHQDNSYQDWHLPGRILTCWLSLSYIDGAESSALAYAVGSHRWPLGSRVSSFTDLSDSAADLRAFASSSNRSLNFRARNYSPGDASFHHGNLWHGSFPNSSASTRLAIAFHLMDGDSRFSDVVSPFFSRFRLGESDAMHDAFFPYLSEG
jgi:ectoine hydroxylase-related dioxygenase (phytanoyl-CoA dioxygenase family)